MKTRVVYCCTCIVVMALCACHNDQPQHTGPPLTQKQVNNGLIDSHKKYLAQQEDEIQQYIKLHNYTMQRTASGIYYMITEPGKGELAQLGEIATVAYTISLLDGTLCYDTKTTGAVQFKIGEDEVESGIHEAVQLMHVGDRATFIIPSNLANGLVGDRDKIPPGAIVVYDIRLNKVQDAKPALAK